MIIYHALTLVRFSRLKFKILFMKKLVLFFALILGYTAIQAQNTATPEINQKQREEKARIRQGERSGEITKAESKELRKDQRDIHKEKMKAKKDGDVTPKEKAKIKHKQRKAGKNIHEEKHDGKKRKKADDEMKHSE